MSDHPNGQSDSLSSTLQSLLPSMLLMSTSRDSKGGQFQMIQMILVVILPLILQAVVPKLRALLKNVRRSGAHRTIAHTRDPSVWWGQDKDDEEALNQVIQRSILTYINKKMPEIAKTWTESDVHARKEDKSTVPVVSTGSSDVVSSCSDSVSESSASVTSRGGLSSSYSHYSYLCAPPNGVWVDLKNGIELERAISKSSPDGNGRSSRQITTTFSLRSKSRWVGPTELNNFIDTCVELHNQELRSKVDMSRYLYTPVLSAAAAADDKTKTDMLYKKYKLSDTRTFTAFFHPEKEQILSVVNQFTNKTGKFAIPGYPQKLGFLLYGPPGTGKTSFIKALAQYTNRHIVNIPLSKIRTNQELMNIMFDQTILLSGSEDGSPSSLPHSRVIFVMEDVDAASGVVHRRETIGTDHSIATGFKTSADASAAEAMALAAAMITSTESLTATPAKMEGSSKASAGFEVTEYGAASTCTDNATAVEAPAGPFTLKDFLKSETTGGNDKLNLAGLLNVLDGVVDSPERIVIMTTNHPEKLDPALIRPGRINRKVYLGNVKLNEAAGMMRHYFNNGQLLSSDYEDRLKSFFVDGLLSPAQIESTCAECESVEDMLLQLKKMLVETMLLKH